MLELNGEPGAVMSHDGMSDAAITVGVVDGRVQQVWLVRNPDKLTTLPAIPS